jgi:AraC family transcriptional regulator
MVLEPTIIEQDELILVGLSFFGHPFQSGEWTEENEIGRLWDRFITYLRGYGDRLKHIRNNEACYEVHIQHEETASKGHFEVFVGLEVEKLEAVPVEMIVKILPPTKYAIFTLGGTEITGDWPRQIYHDWLPASGYQEAHNYNFQLYDQRFKGMDNLDESVIDVYVPVKR